MSWFNSKLRSSFSALLGVASPAPSPGEAISLEDVRQIMMELAGQDGSERASKLLRRIRYAPDVEALWFMRGELMALLSRNLGEAAALSEVERLSAMFTDLLPSGLRSRPSPLSSNYRGDR
jgi:hypothetical protein